MCALPISSQVDVSKPYFVDSSGNWAVFCVVWRIEALGASWSKVRPGTQDEAL